MTKRHTNQNNKQALGQYFTTNADFILEGYEHLVSGKKVMDPFVGGKDLTKWALKNGANETIGYDLDPKSNDIIRNDSLLNPPDYTEYFLVTNPPYLSSNKCKGDKSVFEKWKESDFYKCHLASLNVNNCEEALEIVPSNFFCESRDGIRKRLFATHYIVSAKYWDQPVFDDATTGICVLHLKRGVKETQQFKLRLMPSDITIDVELKAENNFLHGQDFFDYIRNVSQIKILKTDIGMSAPNTKLVVGLLDNGFMPVGLSYNEGEDIFCKPKSFTTYQLTLPDYVLTEEQQKDIVDLFQTKLSQYRTQYHSMFLANYMGPAQKILSRSYVHILLSKVIMELKIPSTSLFQYSHDIK